jgi:HAD superfamily hydrolase (TIGR01490 family)
VVGSARLDTLDPEEESAEMSQSSTQPQPEPATGPATSPGDAPLRPAAFFDLDKTLIATSAATAFARPFLLGGLLSRRAMLRSAGAQIAFLLGSATEGRTERVRAQLSAMVAGWDVAQVSSIVAANLREAVDAVLYAEALDLVARHHAAGEDVVVVSASSEELVRPIADLVGADQVVASRMGVAEGRYTGEIAFYAYGPAKAEAMRELARQQGYDLAASSAYTDSATDAPMLRAVGHGYVVNPDRALRRLALQEGWTPLLFRRRVLVRRLGTTRSARVTVAASAGLLAAALVIVTLARRRR